MVETVAGWTEAEAIAIREQLSRMLQCDLFAQANRQCRFLNFIVEATLSGQAERLNQFMIGVDVFDRDESFDPVTDSIVRVEAGRLRSKLNEYYAGIGQDDPILISLPKGGYGVLIQIKSGQEATRAPTSERISKQPKTSLIVLVVGLIIGGVYVGFFMPANIETTGDLSNALQTQNADNTSESVVQLIKRQAEKPIIAILPFDNMSTDPAQEYFSDGITEDIITDLSIISGLTVIARHSTFVYKGKSFSIREIGEKLGARYVLEGSVRKDGNRLRITTQLIDSLTDTQIWANRYDRNLDDIFAIQSEVSRMIVNALEVKLTDLEQKRLGHKGTDNTEAHDFFLRAREQFYLFTGEDINNSINLFSKSIDLDPLYAKAYAWKSRVLVYTFITGINNSSKETIGPALALARKAIELDDLLPMAHANLGWALRWSQEIEEAISEVGVAIELDANFADGYLWQSLILSAAGRGQEALVSVEQGIRVNPNYGVTYIFALGRAYLILGQNENALYQFDRGVVRNPNFILNHVYKIFVLELVGKNEEAAAAEDELMQVYPDYRFSAAYLFYTDEQQNTSNTD